MATVTSLPPGHPRLQAALAWGSDGVRVDLFEPDGTRRYEWNMRWKDVAEMVVPGAKSPVARASRHGVDFIAINASGHTVLCTWTWDELVERAIVSASPVGDP